MKIQASITIEFQPGDDLAPSDELLPIRAEMGSESLHIRETGEGRIQIDASFLSDGTLGKMMEEKLVLLVKEIGQ